MHKKYNLRFRVTLAFTAFGALVSVLMAIFQILATHDLSQRLIDETLSAELDDYFARRERNPHSLPPSTVTLHGYVQGKDTSLEAIPKYLRLLPPGRHDLEVGALTYRVAIADHDQMRFFLLFDTTLQQRRENRNTLFIGASIIIAVLASTIIGIWLVEIIVAPVTELAARVRNRQPGVWTIQFVDDFSNDEVGELARAFDYHLTRLHVFMEREQAFTSDLNHELRTSLTVILTTIEILLDDESFSEKQRKRLLRIDRAAREMEEMGTSLLLMSREQDPHALAENVRIDQVIDEVVVKHRPLLTNKPIQVTVLTNPELLVNADRRLVFVVVANLIRNAFTYTEHGEIKIVQDTTALTITDSGCGMHAHQTESIFRHQFRASSYTRGSGVGLSLVKRICDQYGWTIKLTSLEGCGTTVSIFFAAHDADSVKS